VRVYVDEQRRRHFAELLGYCAEQRKGFQVVAAENLARIAGSIHHEGIAILARAIRRWQSADLVRAVEDGRVDGPLIYLDGVQNPHNVGSILRTAAHFGTGAVLGAAGDLPPLSSAAVRVAEGAAEFVPVCDLADPAADLGRLRRLGFAIAATSSHRGDPLHAARLGRRVVVVLGGEGGGVSRSIESLADQLVRIAGTGVVESLNVAVACGILLEEVWRRSH